jgi:hypothetical protein
MKETTGKMYDVVVGGRIILGQTLEKYDVVE